MARKVKLQSQSNRKKGSAGKFLFYLLLVSFLAVVIYLLFFSGYLAINNINVYGQENVPEEAIKTEIRGFVSGRILGVIEKNNLLLINTSAREKEISQKFKKINHMEIKRKFPSELAINISEKKLKMIFCAREKCFFLDENGIAFEEVDRNHQDFVVANLPVLNDDSNHEISINEKTIDPTFIIFVEKIKKSMETELNIFLEREFWTPNKISGDLRFITNEGWRIYFDAGLNPQKETSILRTVLEEKIPAGARGNLEYIDLRADNKVFYKFKEGVEEEIKSEEEKKADEQPKVVEEKKKKKTTD